MEFGTQNPHMSYKTNSCGIVSKDQPQH